MYLVSVKTKQNVEFQLYSKVFVCVQVWSHGIESVVDLPTPALFLRTSEDEKLLFAGAFTRVTVWLSFLIY